MSKSWISTWFLIVSLCTHFGCLNFLCESGVWNMEGIKFGECCRCNSSMNEMSCVWWTVQSYIWWSWHLKQYMLNCPSALFDSTRVKCSLSHTYILAMGLFVFIDFMFENFRSGNTCRWKFLSCWASPSFPPHFQRSSWKLQKKISKRMNWRKSHLTQVHALESLTPWWDAVD